MSIERTALPCGLACGVVAAIAFLTWGCSRPAIEESLTPLYAHPGGCKQCHTNLVQNVPAAPPEKMPCIESGCHESVRETPVFVHAPVELSDCTKCHLPHAAAERYLLAAPEREQCISCHGRLLHCPARDGRSDTCTSCHAPHGGPWRYFLPLPKLSEVLGK